MQNNLLYIISSPNAFKIQFNLPQFDLQIDIFLGAHLWHKHINLFSYNYNILSYMLQMTKGWRRHLWPLHSMTQWKNFHCLSSKLCFASCPQEESFHQQTQSRMDGKVRFPHPVSEKTKKSPFVMLLGWLCLPLKEPWDCCLWKAKRWAIQISLKEGLAALLWAAWLADSFQLSGPPELQRASSPGATSFLG